MQKNEKLPENIKPEMIGDKRYVRINEGARRYSVSSHTFRMMAAEAHAIIHVRRIVLIDTKMIDEYLEAFREDMDKIAGIEEVLQDIGSLKRMQEKRALKYLDLFFKSVLVSEDGIPSF